MISVEGDFVRTCCTGEGEFGIKRGNIGVLAGFGLFLAGILRGGVSEFCGSFEKFKGGFLVLFKS